MGDLQLNLNVGALLSGYAIEESGGGSTVNGGTARVSLLNCHTENGQAICHGAYLQGQYQDSDRFTASAGYAIRAPHAINRFFGFYGNFGLRGGRTLDYANGYHDTFYLPIVGLELAGGLEFNPSRYFGVYAGLGGYTMFPFPVIGGQLETGVRVSF